MAAGGDVLEAPAFASAIISMPCIVVPGRVCRYSLALLVGARARALLTLLNLPACFVQDLSYRGMHRCTYTHSSMSMMLRLISYEVVGQAVVRALSTRA